MISWEYLAGFVDGEAYIGLIPDRGRLRPKFCIANTDTHVMDLIAEFLSCKIYDRKLQLHTATKTVELVIWGNKVIPILENLIPYLIVKKNASVLVLDYAKAHMTGNIKVGRKRKVHIELSSK